MPRVLIVLLATLTTLQAQDRRITPVDGGRRVALVIGNRNYARIPLANPINDAQDMQRALTADGFQVTVATDTTLKSMQKSIREFGESVRPGDTALFYYSGHGLQVRGVNYLLPIDFAAQSDDAVPDEAYPAQRVQELLEQAGAKFRILILDACRDNPLPSSKSLGSGLAPMNGGEGTYIVFATAENTVASDNPGQRNGLFTKHLLEVMNQPGMTLDQVLKETKRRVAQESRNLQRPWIYSDSTDDFYFRPGTADSPASGPKPDPAELRDRAAKLREGGKHSEAAVLYLQAAEGGDTESMIMLGILYRQGQGVREDRPEAVRWFRKAADAGSTAGMEEVGLMYMNGWGVAPDEAEGARWYRRAAEAGSAYGMRYYGTWLEHGTGVAQDYAEAMRWYRKSVEAGNADAMVNLGNLFEKGLGVPKNLPEAISWYRKAAAQGSQIGRQALDRLGVQP